MKRDQNALERRLWDERNAILKKYEDKVKVARTKCVQFLRLPRVPLNAALDLRASMIGVGLSRHEADVRILPPKTDVGAAKLERVSTR